MSVLSQECMLHLSSTAEQLVGALNLILTFLDQGSFMLVEFHVNWFMSTDTSSVNAVMYHSESGGCCDCGDPEAWKDVG